MDELTKAHVQDAPPTTDALIGAALAVSTLPMVELRAAIPAAIDGTMHHAGALAAIAALEAARAVR